MLNKTIALSALLLGASVASACSFIYKPVSELVAIYDHVLLVKPAYQWYFKGTGGRPDRAMWVADVVTVLKGPISSNTVKLYGTAGVRPCKQWDLNLEIGKEYWVFISDTLASRWLFQGESGIGMPFERGLPYQDDEILAGGVALTKQRFFDSIAGIQ